MNNKITLQQIEKILECRNLEETSITRLLQGFRMDKSISANKPDDRVEIDPRGSAVVLYSSNREKRPKNISSKEEKSRECPICAGKTTKIVDLTALTSGYSFINRNLFPILFPDSGAHFLQWSSSYHEKDWHNMPLDDRIVLLERLASLEKKMLFENSSNTLPASLPSLPVNWDNSRNASGFVSIIKNSGAAAGGSLEHGHQQIGWSTTMPNNFGSNLRFKQNHGIFFADFLSSDNPSELTIRKYSPGKLLVPYFMKRPYNLIYIPENSAAQYLHDLSPGELKSMAKVIGDVFDCYHRLLPMLGKETAYNILVHNGPGAGLYLEFLPHTQEIGGFEQLGLWICQGSPENSARTLREMIR